MEIVEWKFIYIYYTWPGTAAKNATSGPWQESNINWPTEASCRALTMKFMYMYRLWVNIKIFVGISLEWILLDVYCRWKLSSGNLYIMLEVRQSNCQHMPKLFSCQYYFKAKILFPLKPKNQARKLQNWFWFTDSYQHYCF